MDDLIEALTIFKKYSDTHNPTHCEHDTLYIVGPVWGEISDEDRERLDELGFLYSENDDAIISFRFGSA